MNDARHHDHGTGPQAHSQQYPRVAPMLNVTRDGGPRRLLRIRTWCRAGSLSQRCAFQRAGFDPVG
jgi:hypothetical protein